MSVWLWHPASLSVAHISLYPQLWSINAKNRAYKGAQVHFRPRQDHYGFFCVLALGTVRRGQGVWCGRAISRGKRDSPPLFTVGMWHWQSVCSAASFIPAHMPVSTQVPTGGWPKAVVKRFVWASAGRAGHSPIPSSRAGIIWFPRTLLLIQPPYIHTASSRYTQSIIFTLTTGAECKHRGLLTLKYSFVDYPPCCLLAGKILALDWRLSWTSTGQTVSGVCVKEIYSDPEDMKYRMYKHAYLCLCMFVFVVRPVECCLKMVPE